MKTLKILTILVGVFVLACGVKRATTSPPSLVEHRIAALATRTPTRPATRTRTPTVTPIRTPTPAFFGGSRCPEPCDMYQVQFNYMGEPFSPDVTAPFPPELSYFTWPCDPKGNPPGDPVTGINCTASLGAVHP